MRVLIVTSRYPYPSWRGNQVRTAEWIDALAEHQLGVVCPASRGWSGTELPDPSIRVWPYPAGPVRRALGVVSALVGGRPLQEGLYSTGSAQRAVKSVVAEWRPDLVVVQMVRCGWASEVIGRMADGPPVLFDAIDSMGLHFRRAAETAGGWTGAIYRHEAARCDARERQLAARAALTAAVSRRDLDCLNVAEGMVVPVSAREPGVAANPVHPPTVLLSGNLGYRPTVQGALWFACEVWPEVRRRVPEVTWTLAGARPAAAVRRLEAIGGVSVRPDVPDLAAYLASATVAIAPMASGSGVPVKVLEAWATGVPVVAHPWMADGVEGEARGAMVVAASASEWRDAVVELLTDSVSAGKLADAGREAWRRWYHPEKIAGLIRTAVTRAAASD